MKIKCFALWQPWAALVLHGFKLIETRPQYSSHRGLTGILATKKAPDFAERFFYSPSVHSRLRSVGYENWSQLPMGGVQGTVNIHGWLKIVTRDPVHKQIEMNAPQNAVEREFGDYTPGRYGILLRSPDIFLEPFNVNGQQSMLFDVEIPEQYII